MEFGSIAVTLVVALVTILISMTLHEVMHGFVAYALGDDTAKLKGRLTLNPIKHIDPFMTILLPIILALTPGAPIFGGAKPVPYNPARLKYDEWGSALVALAGPMTNLVLAFILFGVFALIGGNNAGFIGSVLLLAVQVNLGFFVFNMLPIPPLDGSRVIYAIAPEFVRRGMEAIERFGIFVIFAIVLLASPLISTIMITAIRFFINLFAGIFGLG